jgi:1,3-beta-glucanosyltransferase GAS5
MTSVFSGGLVYEYSNEASDYGLVTISGSTVTERDDYSALQAAYKKTPNPSGSGGAKASGTSSTCPTKDANWAVDSDALPAMPAPAKDYLTKGAGKGVGLKGPGSQNAGTESESTASAGSGSVTAVATGAASSSSSSASAAAAPGGTGEMASGAVLTGLLAIFGTLAGAALL